MNNSRHSGGGRNPVNKLTLLAFMLTAASAWNGRINAAELGRLFHTPQQRTQLDTQLETQKITGQSVESGGDSEPNYIIVNGVVQKRGGNRIVWINGAAQAAGKSNEKTPATVPVTVPGKAEPVQLKVGQKLLLDTPASAESGNQKPVQRAPEED